MKEFVLNLLPKSLRNPAIAAVGFLRNPKYAWLYSHRFGNLSTSQLRYLIEKQFLAATGHPLNLDNPTTFNEKLQWLKLYYHDPLMTKCADKVLVRDYVRDTIGEQYLIPILGTFNNIDEIDINKLPNRFVLKVNWGSGQNIICKNRDSFDWENAKEKLRHWMDPKGNHYYNSFEWCYKDIQPVIICEEFISSAETIVDYKFMCYNGSVKNMFIVEGRNSPEGMTVTFFDEQFRKLPFARQYPNSRHNPKRPRSWDTMKKLAEQLARPFPFVRVDLYETDIGTIEFGELTFYPGNGTEVFRPKEWDTKLGNMLTLPQKPLPTT